MKQVLVALFSKMLSRPPTPLKFQHQLSQLLLKFPHSQSYIPTTLLYKLESILHFLILRKGFSCSDQLFFSKKNPFHLLKFLKRNEISFLLQACFPNPLCFQPINLITKVLYSKILSHLNSICLPIKRFITQCACTSKQG